MKSIIRITALAVVLLFGYTLAAQTATTTNALSTSSDAVAVYTSGTGSNWQAGNVTKVGYDLFDFGKKNTNHAYVESTIFTVPSNNVSYYAGGAAVQPDISNLFKHLNVPAGDFSFLLDAGAGVLTVTSGTLSTSNVAGHAGAALKWNFSNAASWNVARVETLFSPGKPFRVGLSTGITAFFGK